MVGVNTLTLEYPPWDEQRGFPTSLPDTSFAPASVVPQTHSLLKGFDGIPSTQQQSLDASHTVNFHPEPVVGLFGDEINTLLFSDDPSSGIGSDSWTNGLGDEARPVANSDIALNDLMGGSGMGSSESLTNLGLMHGAAPQPQQQQLPPLQPVTAPMVAVHQHTAVNHMPSHQQNMMMVNMQSPSPWDPTQQTILLQQQQQQQMVVNTHHHHHSSVVTGVVAVQQQPATTTLIHQQQINPVATTIPIATQQQVQAAPRPQRAKRATAQRNWTAAYTDSFSEDEEEKEATEQQKQVNNVEDSDDEYQIGVEELLQEQEDLVEGGRGRRSGGSGNNKSVNGGNNTSNVRTMNLNQQYQRTVAAAGVKRSLPTPSVAPAAKRGAGVSELNGYTTTATTTTAVPTTTTTTVSRHGRPVVQKQYEFEYDDEEDDAVMYRGSRPSSAEGGSRSSRRLQQRSLQPYQGHLPLDSDFVTYDPDEPISPIHGGVGGGASGITTTTTRRPRAASNGTNGAAAYNGKDMSATTAAVAAAKRRSINAAAQRIRATSSRHELKGRPSFSEIVEAGFMRPGTHRFAVGNVEVSAAVGEDGAITYAGARYRAISKFALVVLRERNPTRQSCDGWKEVAWNGEKLDVLRVRVQQHIRQQARRS